MNMKKHLFLLMGILLFSGCKEMDHKKGNEGVNIIQVDLEEQDIQTSRFFSDCKPVVLETNENSLLREISKSYLTPKHLFIKSDHSLFIFNRKGEFVHKIDKSGNGPEEYARLSDFDVDEEKGCIYILDKANQKIVTYNFQGECLNSFPIGIWAIKFVKDSQDQFYIYSGNEAGESNSYKFNLLSHDSAAARFWEIDDHKKGYLHVNSARNFYWKEGIPFFYEAFNDTIYNLKEQEPAYVIRYKNAAPANFYKSQFANIMDFFQKFNQMGYVNSTYNVFESKNNLFFTCYNNGIKYFNVYSKKQNRCISYNRIKDDLLLQNNTLPFDEDEFEFWTNRDNEIVYYISSQFVKENAGNIRDEVYKTWADRLLEDDNPVAVICRLKEE